MTIATKRNVEAVYPLSPMQQGMLFHSLYAPESGVYVEQLSCALRGDLDVEAFQRAWQRVVDRHAALRTAFAWKRTERPLQVVQRQVALPIARHDWRGQSADEQRAALETLLAGELAQGFDLAQAPLMRLHLAREADEVHRFVWTHHHLLIDGWSLPLLLGEVFTCYDAFAGGRDVQLPPARPYRDYISWLQKQDMAEAEAFWRQALRGFRAPTPLAIDRPAPLPATDRPADAEPHAAEEGYGHVRHALSAELTGQLQALARQHQLTLNTLVQGAWALLLHRYSGEDDIVFGATVSGRPAELPGVEQMVGLFINTLPVRVPIDHGQTLLEWLRALQERQAEQRQLEYSPLVEIQGWSEVPRDQPLFSSILVFENYPIDESLRAQQGTLRIADVRMADQTNYPLTVSVGPGRELGLSIDYERARFDDEAMARLAGHLDTLLRGFVANPGAPLAAVPLLSEAELRQLAGWNPAPRPWDLGQNLATLFAAAAARNPQAIAVVDPAAAPALAPDGAAPSPADAATTAPAPLHSITYAQLEARANQLAHALQRHGVGREAPVALLLEKSIPLVIAALAALKAGGAYLPLDLQAPPARLRAILADCRPAAILAQPGIDLSAILPQSSPPGPLSAAERGYRAQRGGGEVSAIALLDPLDPALAAEPTVAPPCPATPDSLAYLIYTSGSTGTPKGVMVSQRSLLSAYYSWEEAYGLREGVRRHLQLASPTFDVFSGDLTRALGSGGTLVLCPREWLLEPARLAALLRDEQIDYAEFVPAVLRALAEHLEQRGEDFGQLRLLVCGSDQWLGRDYARVRRLCGPQTRLINSYGLTEATVDSTYIEGDSLAGEGVLPIGRPYPNSQVYILDAQLRPLPVGVPGELCVGGIAVAKGYLGQPELTAERFVEWDGAGLAAPTRLYRSGDRARYRADGTIEYLGRLDGQLKLRGLRIEPGEIEAALAHHPAVRAAAVAAVEAPNGDTRLVAYVVPHALPPPSPVGEGGRGGEVLAAALRAHLATRVPEYMLPALFVELAALPLTPNGKVDRKALPVPDNLPVEDGPFAAPRTPVEELLAGIWAQLLQAPRVGRGDNFFELGGHSLLATQLLSRLREAFQIELPVRAIFEAPVLAELALRVDSARQASAGLVAPPITPASRDRDLPLSFAQQRLWFIDQLEPGSPLYNNFTSMHLAGDLDVPALERSLTAIVRRHESLRTTFASVDGTPAQLITPAEQIAISIPVIDLRDLPELEQAAEIERRSALEAGEPIDLARDLLLRVQLLRLADQEHIALLTVHHIASDDWSMGVFTAELAALYSAATGGRPAALPELPIQYADYAAWQRAWLQGEVLERQLAYWKGQLAEVPALLELPTDRPRPAVQSYRGAHMPFALSPELTEGLRRLSRQEHSTFFITLLAGFQSLLFRYSGQERFGVGSPIANRTRAELEPLVGFFANTIVLGADLRGEPSFRELLRRVREATLGAHAHQDLPFEMLVEALQPARSLAHAPLFQVMFVMDNAPVEAQSLPDLVISPVHAESGLSRFDLTMEVWEEPDGLHGSLEYNTDLFEQATVERMLGHYTTLLQAAAANPDQPVAALPLLTADERHTLTVAWNQTTAPFPAESCAHQLIERWAASQPQRPAAVMHGGASLTYAELDARANQLAHALQRRGVGPERLVAIALPRSLDLAVAILATLKAGGAFLPLDLAYPAERLRFMLEDARPAVLLTTGAAPGAAELLARAEGVAPGAAELLARAEGVAPGAAELAAHTDGATATTVILLDRDGPEIAAEPATAPPCAATPESLAYCIYTSGSTGTPKGTLLSHRGLVNLSTWQREALAITPASRVLQFAALSFDASVWEYVMALGNGAALALADQETLADGQALLRLLRDQAITTVTLPPSLLAVLEPEALPELATVVAAGEACSRALVERWAPGRRFVNAYGPTETTVCASAYRCDPADDRPPPIGRPINNFQLYVLDPQRQPVPIGVPGELYIGGVGVARGYLNRPELTAERFVEVNELGRLYKSGDLARWRADGTVEFLGRLDHQVKLRGFRIELGEIEAALRAHPAVSDALVLARGQGGGQQLAGYLVLSEAGRQAGGIELLSELRAHLGERLPAYMVPAALVPLEAWPLTPSGKVDRAALPAPEQAAPSSRDYVAPRTPTETMLVELAQEILGLARVGVTDNFFELGGHSLLGTQLVSRVRARSGVELPLRALFEQPTVADLAALIDSLGAARQGEAAQIAELLAQIDTLSDDEVRALLAARA